MLEDRKSGFLRDKMFTAGSSGASVKRSADDHHRPTPRSLLNMLGRTLNPRPSKQSDWMVSANYNQDTNSELVTVVDNVIAEALLAKSINWLKSELVIVVAEEVKESNDTMTIEPTVKKRFTTNKRKSDSSRQELHRIEERSTESASSSGMITDKCNSVGNLDNLLQNDTFESSPEIGTSSHDESYSGRVKISGIPPPFVELLFLRFLEVERRNANIDQNLKAAILSCSVYDADDQSVVVEFLTYKQAQQFCKVPLTFLKRYKLNSELLSSSETNSKLVKISGISYPFVKELFLPFIEAEIRNANIVKDNERAIIACLEYKAADESIIVEFQTVKQALDFCKLTPLNFICDTLHLKIHASEKNLANEVEEAASTSTANPAVTPITATASTHAGNFENVANPVQNPSATASTSTAVQNPSATASTSTAVQNPSPTASTSTAVQNPSATASTSTAAQNPSPTASTSTAVKPSSLRVDWSTHTQLVLLKLMIENRDLLHHTANRKKGEGFQNVCLGMKQKKFFYSESCLRRRMKAIVKLPPPEAVNAVKEFNGEVPLGSSKIDDLIEANPDIQVRVSTHSNRRLEAGFIVVLDDYNCKDNGNLFPGDSESALIHAYIELKPKFDDDRTRSSLVYAEMLKIMHKQGYTHLKVDDLSTRIGGLARDFKLRYDSLLNQTGSGTSPTNWPHYDLMSQLYENSVIIEPQKIRSFGSSFANFSREVRPFSAATNKSAGKSTTSKFLNARQDERNEMHRAVLAQMTRQNDLLELKIRQGAEKKGEKDA